MSGDQQAARVNVSDDEWIEFRTLAMRKRRSIADHLGELVRRELDGPKNPAQKSPPEKLDRPRQRSAPRVRAILDALADGMTEEEIIAEYPTITVKGIRAAAAYGAELARDEYPTVTAQ